MPSSIWRIPQAVRLVSRRGVEPQRRAVGEVDVALLVDVGEGVEVAWPRRSFSVPAPFCPGRSALHSGSRRGRW
ncbi:hypothetical protein ABMY26_06820 (plasmid) [Azospirillum sp. HJ39]|uniref:hypothetical protein n=1 Tax=Azospirillum sp. HJ39 TaxID=3159496 RepID=UPI003556F50C